MDRYKLRQEVNYIAT